MNTPKSEWPVYDILGQEIRKNDIVLFAKASRSSGSLDIGFVTGFTKTRVNYRCKKWGFDWRGGYKNPYADVWANKFPLRKIFDDGNVRKNRWARAFKIEAFVLDRNQTVEALDDFELGVPDYMFTEENRP